MPAAWRGASTTFARTRYDTTLVDRSATTTQPPRCAVSTLMCEPHVTHSLKPSARCAAAVSHAAVAETATTAAAAAAAAATAVLVQLLQELTHAPSLRLRSPRRRRLLRRLRRVVVVDVVVVAPRPRVWALALKYCLTNITYVKRYN